MIRKREYLLFLLQLCWLANGSRAQRSPYSLQAAVDELHRREAAKYPLNAPQAAAQPHYFVGLGEQDYWDDDDAPSTAFRERESQTFNEPENPNLTAQFLHEVEEMEEREREERYKEALHRLWDKYQQQENEIEGEMFQEKKRLRTPPYYMLMQKKRSSYPILPWLPYAAERKKRFPVAKRSTKRSTNEGVYQEKTNEKVARELSELFGRSKDDNKKKRSTDAQTTPAASSTIAPNTANAVSTALTDMHIAMPGKSLNVTEATTKSALSAVPANEHHQMGHAGHHGHTQKEHKHRKRSGDHHSHESHEEEEEYEEHDGSHEEEGDEEEEHEEPEEEEEEESKKKRDLTQAKQKVKGEVIRTDQLLPSEDANQRKKKSIEWSKYFGLDRKKKSVASGKPLSIAVRKRSAGANDLEEEKRKRELDPEKLENMDKKLQSIEDFIIDETIKYTGAHEGISNPEEVRRLKDHVLSRLATAYSLEKMRRALQKLRLTAENENHLLRNVIEAEDMDALENQKRLSVKKEKAHATEVMPFALSNEKLKHINSNSILHANAAQQHRNSADNDNNAADNDDAADNNEPDMRRKKKRNGYLRYPELPNYLSDFEEELGAGNYEALNDAYLGNKNYIVGSNQCPLIESMAERCRGVDLISGDIHQELLPICGVHQICYLCGTSQVACDYQYLAEADSICGNNNDCEAAARSVLMILRGTPGPQLGPRECLKNSCLYSAMREIGL